MNRFIRGIICFYFCIAVLPETVFAVGEFTSDYAVQYVVKQDGTTVVTQNVILTNNLTNLFARQYSIKLDTTAIRNIVAFDSSGQIKPKIIESDGKTEIILLFNEHIVGLGKRNMFTLRFENTEIAQKNGNIWEVNIPGINDSEDLNSYDVTLQVPASFGPASYLKPAPVSGGKWDKSQMTAGGISAAYGTVQHFRVQAEYQLENTQNGRQLTEVAFPPDTSYQKVRIMRVDPAPREIIPDSDGNWMARYEIPSHTKMSIKAEFIISLSVQPHGEFLTPSFDQAMYLKPTKNWNSAFPSITAIAKSHKTPRQIYDYIVDTVLYDYERVNQVPIRKGAVSAIEDPKHSVCMEFTDAFIAIARAAGIPARQVVGYAYTTNTRLRPLSLASDILHAWPEYYDSDKNVWVQVDPTWGSTTGGIDFFSSLDFNHVVFAINGEQDDYPYPVGAYKFTGTADKLIDVSFADEPMPASSSGELELSMTFPRVVFAGISTRGKATVSNRSYTSVIDVPVTISVDGEQDLFTGKTTYLSPYGIFNIPFQYNAGTYFSWGKRSLRITTDDYHISRTFTVIPVYVVLLLTGGGIILTLVSLWKKRKLT